MYIHHLLKEEYKTSNWHENLSAHLYDSSDMRLTDLSIETQYIYSQSPIKISLHQRYSVKN